MQRKSITISVIFAAAMAQVVNAQAPLIDGALSQSELLRASKLTAFNVRGPAPLAVMGEPTVPLQVNIRREGGPSPFGLTSHGPASSVILGPHAVGLPLHGTTGFQYQSRRANIILDPARALCEEWTWRLQREVPRRFIEPQTPEYPKRK
jgi:hypothetical protein